MGVPGRVEVASLARERQVLLDAIDIGGVHLLGFAESTAAFGILRGQQMTASGARMHDFAPGGYLEPFGDRFFRFDTLRASHKLFTFFSKEREL